MLKLTLIGSAARWTTTNKNCERHTQARRAAADIG
jgi:hypothetical protein